MRSKRLADSVGVVALVAASPLLAQQGRTCADLKSAGVPNTVVACPYSQVPTYRGTGDTADAASFECAEPTEERGLRRLFRGGRQ